VAVGALGPIDVLVVDAGSEFAEAGGGMPGLRRAVDDGWNVVRAVVNAGWIAEVTAAGSEAAAATAPARPGGKVIFVAPIADAGEYANAVGAALENAARTLSVEWARFGIRPVALLPGAQATASEVAELAAYLASPAGAYYSGCAFTLR
jgi:NAD(P)-dependent dehydrogenase (short-subunit alcohol dehydrogenase family)